MYSRPSGTAEELDALCAEFASENEDLRARVAELEAALKSVAERQREACALYMRGPESMSTWMDHGNADCVRNTPLVEVTP